MKKFYITTTLPYVNAEPHIGFALEIVQADVVARYHALLGKEVFFNTGTDEHGQKIYQAAEKEGLDTQTYCDKYAAKFDALKEALNLSYTNFVRTTDEHHLKAAQEFWQRCDKNGDIYKKNYQVKYCVGCELEKTDSELVNDRCPLHPNKDLEIRDEENYFFRWSNYQKKLLNFYEANPNFVVPNYRFNEIKEFVKRGLNDFSISRLKEKMPWGIPVPGDEAQVMYVWFDALVNYISAIGYPDNLKKFNAFWPVIQVAGKDNLRQQSAMWQAMLMSVGIKPSKQIWIHGFVTNAGQKMSKSLGNVVNPLDLVRDYGTDAVRYYLLKHVHPFEDSNFSIESFKEVYNADLANGLGNLVSRMANMIEQYLDGKVTIGWKGIKLHKQKAQFTEIQRLISEYKFNIAFQMIDVYINSSNHNIDVWKPWELIKDGKKRKISIILSDIVGRILIVTDHLKPLLPETSEKIEKIFTAKKIKKPEESLFPRI